MPRKRQNVGLEHGGDYGTVQATADSMNPNMGGIPLEEGEVAPDLGGAAPPVVSNTPRTSPQASCSGLFQTGGEPRSSV